VLNSVRVWIAFTLLLFTAAAPAAPQTAETGIVQGTVMGATASGLLAGAQIRLEGGPADPRAVQELIRGVAGRGMAGRRVAVFTSGGPIGFSVNFAVGGPDRSFLELNWRVRNCSVTGFVFSRDRLTLDSFNQVSHLEDAALHTFR